LNGQKENKLNFKSKKMSSLKKYDLVIKSELTELITTVNQAVEMGYYPKGGMQVIQQGQVPTYVQTIYLREEDGK
jgi:hypothetical protein